MMVRFNALLLALLAAISVAMAQPADPLPSWNDGAAKKAITDFVAHVTTQGGADFVPPDPRLRQFSGARLAGIVHYTDAAREYAYDRPSKIRQLDKAWDEAKAKGWTVVDMKHDWKKVFASSLDQLLEA